ncbi:MAG TPA: IS200/IS605 family transposase [Pyrinomonadaceae bacterium]|jgi:REP element-mobilizing transposase RayT|nr:IS200/IS605 family transposase [Pyrinomonadaceae bacterium]
MPHTYTNFIFHVVFATKERAPLITNELKPRLYEYLGGTIRGLDGILLEIGGIKDHIHLLIKLKPTIKFSDFMRELKANSSTWANRLTNGRVEWQNGYGAFTVGETQIEIVRRYIKNQEIHHAKLSFDDEFKDMLNRSGIDFDEKYLWR